MKMCDRNLQEGDHEQDAGDSGTRVPRIRLMIRRIPSRHTSSSPSDEFPVLFAVTGENDWSHLQPHHSDDYYEGAVYNHSEDDSVVEIVPNDVTNPTVYPSSSNADSPASPLSCENDWLRSRSFEDEEVIMIDATSEDSDVEFVPNLVSYSSIYPSSSREDSPVVLVPNEMPLWEPLIQERRSENNAEADDIIDLTLAESSQETIMEVSSPNIAPAADSPIVISESSSPIPPLSFAGCSSPTRKVLNSDAECQRLRLMNELNSNMCVCVICMDVIGPKFQIWPCNVCHNLFHLSCVRRWAKTNCDFLGKPSSWRCPICREEKKCSPNRLRYRCFCRRVPKPSPRLGVTPHSCGGKCKKRCGILCHPGPCPSL